MGRQVQKAQGGRVLLKGILIESVILSKAGIQGSRNRVGKRVGSTQGTANHLAQLACKRVASRLLDFTKQVMKEK